MTTLALKVCSRVLRLNPARKTFRALSIHKSSSTDSSYIYHSQIPEINEPKLPIHQYIWQNIKKWPHMIAIECAFTGKKYSYSELHTLSRRFGASLKKLGLKQGDPIAIFIPNIPEYPIVYLGSYEIGLVVNTINNNYTLGELIYQLKDTATKCIVCDSTNIHLVEQARKQLKKNIIIICIQNHDSTGPEASQNLVLFKETVNESVDTSTLTDIEIDLNDTALIAYSSGTTGLPKGVCLTHRTITTNLTQYLHPSLNVFLPSNEHHQAVVPAYLPFFHAYGNMGVMLGALTNGSKLVSFPKFDPKSFLQILSTSKAISLLLVPPVLLFLANTEEVTKKHLKGVRVVLSAAAPLSTNDMDRFYTKCKVPIVQAYGMTECSPLVIMKSHEDSKYNKLSVGKLLPNTSSKILDMDTGKPVPPNVNGEMCFKGPQIMKGYLNNVEATREMIDSEGWLHSGDVGYIDQDGFFYLTDRLKEMIKVSGFQVAPAELEDVLRKHPDVAEAGVVAKASDKTGETPVAFVQVKPGKQPKPQDIMDFASSFLTKHKQISEIKFLDSIPKTASGKIIRKDLKKLL